MGILRLGYLEIRVKEINKAAQYYTQVLGLKETARAAGKIYLKAWDEWEHHQVVLVEDSSPGLNYMIRAHPIWWKGQERQNICVRTGSSFWIPNNCSTSI